MRKPAFCICENKDRDQLRGNRKADQRLCFRYTDSRITLLPKSEISSLCGCTAQFVSDLAGDPEDRGSQNEALLILDFFTPDNRTKRKMIKCLNKIYENNKR